VSKEITVRNEVRNLKIVYFLLQFCIIFGWSNWEECYWRGM